MTRRRRRKSIWPWMVALALLLAGAYSYQTVIRAQTPEADNPSLQTATVRRGDITISAVGRGSVQPAGEVALGFKGGGVLADLLVEPGDYVTVGQPLARLDDTDALRQLRQAQINVELAELRQAETLAQTPSPEARRTAALQLEQAQLSVQQAEGQLAAATLVAPQAGTINRLNAAVGDSVGASAILTIANLDNPLVRFNLEESDLDKAIVGTKTRITFDAYPDSTFEGTLLRLEPTVTTIQNVPAVHAWTAITPTADMPSLLIGLSADVEIIVGEASRAFLVPVQALRELAPGEFAVFLVDASGELRITPVEVGLRNFASAEILSGLQSGDVVSTGTVEAP
jgi:RND family efflux transporter MFP subunit